MVRATGTGAPHWERGGRWTSGQRSFMDPFSSWHLWPLGPVSVSVFLVFCSLLRSVLFFFLPSVRCCCALFRPGHLLSSLPWAPPPCGGLPCHSPRHTASPTPPVMHPQFPSPALRSTDSTSAQFQTRASSRVLHLKEGPSQPHRAQARILGAGKPIALPSHLQVSGLSSSLYSSLRPEVSTGWGLLHAPWLHPC